MAALNLQKLSRLDWGILGAAFIAFIALFLPWYGFSAGVFSASVTGWSTSYGWLGALLMIAAGVYHTLHRSEVNLAKMPLGPSVTVLATALLGTLIVALRWLTLPSGHGSVAGVSVYSYGPRVGIIIALIVGLIETACAFALFRASSETLPWAKSTTTPTSGAGAA